ncbi:hypothetical protein [Yoonia sp. BS5-3]|uniref:DUF423 domain-containing protein n=1 Tax=Yoonia phaeophyticola TaxID=3137369 RepID=A0ABZ2V690_9RHOB
MNIPYAAAGGLMLLTAGIHVFAGGPEYHSSFQTQLPNQHLASMAAVLWHAVTINLLVFAAAYLWLSKYPSTAVMAVVGVIQLGWAGLFLFYGITMLNSPWPMPQWVIFLAIPLLSLYGLHKARVN